MRVAGHRKGELQAGGKFGAVELTVVDCGREPVHVLRIPTAPERRLAVHVHEIQVMREDVVHDANVVGSEAGAFGRIGGHELPHHGMGERLGADLIAAGVALPLPAGIGRVAPAVGIGELEALALERARGETGVGVDALQALQCGEQTPRLAGGFPPRA